MVGFKLFLTKKFSQKERETARPERTKVLKQMTPGEINSPLDTNQRKSQRDLPFRPPDHLNHESHDHT